MVIFSNTGRFSISISRITPKKDSRVFIRKLVKSKATDCSTICSRKKQKDLSIVVGERESR